MSHWQASEIVDRAVKALDTNNRATDGRQQKARRSSVKTTVGKVLRLTLPKKVDIWVEIDEKQPYEFDFN